MGLLLKILLFGMIFFYIMKTIGGFLFRIMGGRMQQHQQRNTPPPRKEGEVNIDYAQKGNGRGSKGGAKGGEYIDYEEIK